MTSQSAKHRTRAPEDRPTMGSTRWWRALEVAAWALGLALVMAVVGLRVLGEYERSRAVAEFPGRTTIQTVPMPAARSASARANPLPAPATPDQTEWSQARIRAHAASSGDADPSPDSPLALLRIPRIALEVPVYAELNERNLNRGAALVDGSAAPDSNGNVAIAAHRDGYFRALQAIAVGDVVDIDLASGQRSYRVTELSVVDPTDVRSIQPTASAVLTLVTCYPFRFVGSAPQRFIVRAEAMP